MTINLVLKDWHPPSQSFFFLILAGLDNAGEANATSSSR
jgi:hypothetical protein